MKKLTLLLLLPFSVNLLLAQNYLLQNLVTPSNSNVYQDANSLIGIGTTTPAANLDVVGGCGLCETAIPIIGPHYSGGLSPAPDYITASRDYSDWHFMGPASFPDFNVNPIGQVGIGGANEPGGPFGANDLLIQTHNWPSDPTNPNGIISSFDDNGNLLFVAGNCGEASNSSAVLAIVGNSNYTRIATFQVLDGGLNLSNPIIAASATGAIGMGTSGPMAQLDINNNMYYDGSYTPLDYLLHVGDDYTPPEDYLTVANNSNVEVGIGILPTSFSTLAIRGSSLTMFDLFEQSGQQAGIRFYGSDGDQRHLIYDDVGLTGNLIIWPGADEEGVSNTLEVVGTTQVDVNLAVGGNETVAGTIAIGCPAPEAQGSGAYSTWGLSVQGQVVAGEVVVTTTSWCDSVFSNTYHLKSLDEVQNFISQNHHLPGVPSEKEVIKDGISLGDMNKVLLEKVEELTLYVMKQQREIDELKAK